MGGRSIYNYTKPWRHSFIYAEMAVGQSDHTIKISEKIRHPAIMKHARDWNNSFAISPVASSEFLAVASIARECGSFWSYIPVFVLIRMHAEFLCARISRRGSKDKARRMRLSGEY